MSEKRYYEHPMLGVCDRSNHGEPLNHAQCRDRLNDLEAERDDYRTALANRNNELDAVVKERDRYVAALEQIELMDPDWTLGVDENMSRLQSIAGRALKGGGDGHEAL